MWWSRCQVGVHDRCPLVVTLILCHNYDDNNHNNAGHDYTDGAHDQNVGEHNVAGHNHNYGEHVQVRMLVRLAST